MKKLAIIIIAALLSGCSAGLYRFKKGDTVYTSRGLFRSTRFVIDKVLPDGHYGAWDLNTNSYAPHLGGGSLKLVKPKK